MYYNYMSFPNDIDPYNFFRNLFGVSGGRRRREGRSFGGWNFDDMFREFDDMRRETERIFSEQFKNIENKVPKESNKRIRHTRRRKSERSWSHSIWILHDNRS